MLHTLPRLTAAAIFAALLSACGGGGSSFTSTSLPSTASSSAVQLDASAVLAGGHAMLDGRGNMAHIMFPRNPLAASGSNATGRACRRNCGSVNLSLHGGPVSTTPTVYLVLWGAAWGGSGDPHGAATYMQSFYSHMGGTGWHNTDTQYYGANGVHIVNTTLLAATYNDTASNPPSSPSQSQIGAEAAKYAAVTGKYGPNYSYVIALPSGISPSGFKTQYCAYHSSTNATGGVVSYTNLPYQSDAGSSCGVGSVTSPGYLDGFSIVGGHEQVETETDPQPNTGWLDSSGSENGDKCAWTNLQNTNLNGVSFPTQPIWDNAITGCSQSGP